MLRKPDEDGRYPVSVAEYEALRTIFGAVNAMDTEALKDRCHLVENGWRDIRLAQNKLQTVMRKLLSTIPFKKLAVIQTELHNTVCRVQIKPASGHSGNGLVYVDQGAMVRIMERAIQMDCILCDKSAKECKRCQLYKDLNACFPYELSKPEDTLCPFAGVSELRQEE